MNFSMLRQKVQDSSLQPDNRNLILFGAVCFLGFLPRNTKETAESVLAAGFRHRGTHEEGHDGGNVNTFVAMHNTRHTHIYTMLSIIRRSRSLSVSQEGVCLHEGPFAVESAPAIFST